MKVFGQEACQGSHAVAVLLQMQSLLLISVVEVWVIGCLPSQTVTIVTRQPSSPAASAPAGGYARLLQHDVLQLLHVDICGCTSPIVLVSASHQPCTSSEQRTKRQVWNWRTRTPQIQHQHTKNCSSSTYPCNFASCVAVSPFCKAQRSANRSNGKAACQLTLFCRRGSAFHFNRSHTTYI